MSDNEDKLLTMRFAIRDQLIDLLATPNAPAMSPELASEYVQRLLIAHGWLIREGAFETLVEGFDDPIAVAHPKAYVNNMVAVATAERVETTATLSALAKMISTFINPPEGKKYLN